MCQTTQLEIILFQSHNEHKAKYISHPLLDLYRLYINAEDFVNFRRHALQFVSLFGTTYRCEQFLY